jgi:hypothetical protein
VAKAAVPPATKIAAAIDRETLFNTILLSADS